MDYSTPEIAHAVPHGGGLWGGGPVVDADSTVVHRAAPPSDYDGGFHEPMVVAGHYRGGRRPRKPSQRQVRLGIDVALWSAGPVAFALGLLGHQHLYVVGPLLLLGQWINHRVLRRCGVPVRSKTAFVATVAATALCLAQPQVATNVVTAAQVAIRGIQERTEQPPPSSTSAPDQTTAANPDQP